MGLFAAWLSTFFSAAKDLVSKRLSIQVDGMTSTFASFAFALPFYVVLLLALLAVTGPQAIQFTGTFFLLLFLRASTDSFAEGLKMHSLNYGDISLMASFLSLSPLFLLVLSPLITGDPLSLAGVVAVILVVGGSVLLVYRPSGHGWAQQKKGILLATLASVFFALNNCYDRLALFERHPEEVELTVGLFKAAFAGFSMTLMSACFIFPLIAFRRDRWQSMRLQWRGLLTRGFFEIAFMVAKLFSVRYIPATDVTVIQRFAIILSIIGGRVLFREKDFGRRLAAGVLILAGIALEVWFRIGEIAVRPEASP